MSFIPTLLAIVDLVLGILVLIKLFQKEGALKGILGLICMIYTFIWGWMKVNENNNRNIMIIWTVVIVLTIVANIALGASTASQLAQ